jgi:hypothetical protein
MVAAGTKLEATLSAFAGTDLDMGSAPTVSRRPGIATSGVVTLDRPVMPPTPTTCRGEKGVRRDHAALEYRWCRPPTRESATTLPALGGSVARATGASPWSAMCGRSSL